MTIQAIKDLVEAGIKAGTIDKDAARAALTVLSLKGDEAMLAVRLVADGADPASLEYLRDGEVSIPIALAHGRGPAGLTGNDRTRWLALAAASVDESKAKTRSLRERVLDIAAGLDRVRLQKEHFPVRDLDAEKTMERLRALPFQVETIMGREMRVYSNDLGFAAAYWNGEPCAAVRGVGIMFVASASEPLASLGVDIPDVGQRGPSFAVLSEDGTRGLPRA